MYSYDRSRTAASDTLYSACQGVIARVLAYIQPGLQKLEGADPDLGTYSMNGYLNSVFVEGALTVGGKPHYAAKWSIDIKATTNGHEALFELTGKSEYLSAGTNTKVTFDNFTDAKHMADGVVRHAQQIRIKLAGRG